VRSLQPPFNPATSRNPQRPDQTRENNFHWPAEIGIEERNQPACRVATPNAIDGCILKVASPENRPVMQPSVLSSLVVARTINPGVSVWTILPHSL